MESKIKNHEINESNKKPSVFIAIISVFKREIKITLRYSTWFIPMLIWPIIMPFGYIFMSKAFIGTDNVSLDAFSTLSGTNDYTSYILIGVLMWSWINSMLWSFGTSLRTEQLRGTLESNWLCPVPKISLLFGYSIYQLLYNIMSITISILEFKLIYGFEFKGNPLLGILIILISIPSVYGLGFIFASLVLWVKEANAMVNLIRGIVMVFCGITYPLAVLPNWMKNISTFIPMTYSIKALRKVTSLGVDISQVKNEIFILLLSGLILMILGIVAFNYTQKKVRNTGALGNY